MFLHMSNWRSQKRKTATNTFRLKAWLLLAFFIGADADELDASALFGVPEEDTYNLACA